MTLEISLDTRTTSAAESRRGLCSGGVLLPGEAGDQRELPAAQQARAPLVRRAGRLGCAEGGHHLRRRARAGSLPFGRHARLERGHGASGLRMSCEGTPSVRPRRPSCGPGVGR